MAIYHCSIKVISRGKGKSAVAAAYRAGEKITNQFDGMTPTTTPTKAVSSIPRFYYPTTPRRICGQGGFVERG